MLCCFPNETPVILEGSVALCIGKNNLKHVDPINYVLKEKTNYKAIYNLFIEQYASDLHARHESPLVNDRQYTGTR